MFSLPGLSGSLGSTAQSGNTSGGVSVLGSGGKDPVLWAVIAGVTGLALGFILSTLFNRK